MAVAVSVNSPEGAISLLTEIAKPSAPATGGRIYVKSDNKLYFLDQTDTETDLTAGAGGVSSVSGTAPIASSGGATPAISITDMTATSGGGGGARGSVPASSAGDQLKLLTAAATWIKYGARETVALNRFGSSTASISITPSGLYNTLTFIGLLRTDGATTADSLTARLNADSTATNYRGARLAGNSAGAPAVTDNNGATATFINAASICGASSPASYFSLLVITVFNILSTTEYKTVLYTTEVTTAEAAGGYSLVTGKHTYKSTSAITGLTLAPVTGSNFVTGTQYMVWEN